MKPPIDPQELARKNNENAAIDHAFRTKRRPRRKQDRKPLQWDKLRDAIDRLAAEREPRPVRAVGFFLPKNP